VCENEGLATSLVYCVKATLEKFVNLKTMCFWLLLKHSCSEHFWAWNCPGATGDWDTSVHDLGFQPRTTRFAFTVAWHLCGLLIVSLRHLQYDNQFMRIDVHLQVSHRDFFNESGVTAYIHRRSQRANKLQNSQVLFYDWIWSNQCHFCMQFTVFNFQVFHLWK